MSYHCGCDCNDNSYIFLLLDYMIRIGNVIGFFYFIIKSDYFNDFFKNVLHGGNSEWVKIKKEDYNIINSNSSSNSSSSSSSNSNESDSENEHQEDGKEKLVQEEKNQ